MIHDLIMTITLVFRMIVPTYKTVQYIRARSIVTAKPVEFQFGFTIKEK